MSTRSQRIRCSSSFIAFHAGKFSASSSVNYACRRGLNGPSRCAALLCRQMMGAEYRPNREPHAANDGKENPLTATGKASIARIDSRQGRHERDGMSVIPAAPWPQRCTYSSGHRGRQSDNVCDDHVNAAAARSVRRARGCVLLKPARAARVGAGYDRSGCIGSTLERKEDRKRSAPLRCA